MGSGTTGWRGWGHKAVLLASLAVNLLVVGAIAGWFINHWKDGPPPPRRDSYAVPYIRSLAPEDRREIIRALRAARTEAGMTRGARTAAFAAVIDALESEPFDRAAIEDALMRQREVASARQVLAEGIWLDRVAAMPAEDRLAYVARLRADLEERREGKPRDR